MGFNCGIVGLPNVGKSTLFNALTASGVEASNYPFCTIDPNVGIVNVPDKRLTKLSELYAPERTVPTTIEFVDIAGLVKGAAAGEGLGNQFLSHIRQVSAIAHVVRCFENENILHVQGDVNPERDIDIIETELVLKDLETVEKRIQAVEKKARSGDKEAATELNVLQELRAHLDSGRLAKNFPRTDDNARILTQLCLLTDKPVMLIANTDEHGVRYGNPYIDTVRRIAERNSSVVVPICADIEAEIAELDEADRAAFLEDMGMAEPGLHRVIREGYALLHLITYFTAGKKEVRAWTIKAHTKAPQAAGVIHSDFEKGFIRAEVMKYDDLIRLGSEAAVKEAGLYRIEGRDYTIHDGDILYFRFNV
ncbi:MAG: redox-regulated ATPase YchF [Bacteroidota bacterium]|nr:redox-regulated ATPase YchF [Candidatus Kapabacteria bacterium]MDW8221120.1 redox-regulated ATPase YchF [Bacteroidota bacterium]